MTCAICSHQSRRREESCARLDGPAVTAEHRICWACDVLYSADPVVAELEGYRELRDRNKRKETESCTRVSTIETSALPLETPPMKTVERLEVRGDTEQGPRANSSSGPSSLLKTKNIVRDTCDAPFANDSLVVPRPTRTISQVASAGLCCMVCEEMFTGKKAFVAHCRADPQSHSFCSPCKILFGSGAALKSHYHDARCHVFCDECSTYFDIYTISSHQKNKCHGPWAKHGPSKGSRVLLDLFQEVRPKFTTAHEAAVTISRDVSGSQLLPVAVSMTPIKNGGAGKALRCALCRKSQFPNSRALRQHNETKHAYPEESGSTLAASSQQEKGQCEPPVDPHSSRSSTVPSRLSGKAHTNSISVCASPVIASEASNDKARGRAIVASTVATPILESRSVRWADCTGSFLSEAALRQHRDAEHGIYEHRGAKDPEELHNDDYWDDHATFDEIDPDDYGLDWDRCEPERDRTSWTTQGRGKRYDTSLHWERMREKQKAKSKRGGGRSAQPW